ncbi:MAG: type II toxin-antitoxin system VapC family toxin [Pseudomonadota bacterium]
MKLLLDTHVALWAVANDRSLSKAARSLIADPGNDIFVSVASLWEIGIKHALKRKGAGAMRVSSTQAHKYFTSAGYLLLPITSDHACAVEALPALHSDPFDRMLVAQAKTEPLRLVTHDNDVVAYDPGFVLV